MVACLALSGIVALIRNRYFFEVHTPLWWEVKGDWLAKL